MNLSSAALTLFTALSSTASAVDDPSPSIWEIDKNRNLRAGGNMFRNDPPKKVDICHYDEEEGVWKKITISEKAVSSHMKNHDDAMPGDATSGSSTPLDDDCVTLPPTRSPSSSPTQSPSSSPSRSPTSSPTQSPSSSPTGSPKINFDDITGGLALINAGYAGLNWINMYTLDSPTYSCQQSGYITGNVSPSRVAYNAGARPATVWSTSPFSVKSFYGTAAWFDNLVLTVTGYQGSTGGNGGNLVGTYTVTLPAPSSGAQFHDLDASNSNVSGNFNNIDRLYIETSGGTTVNVCGVVGGDQVAIDNLNVIF